MVGSYFPPKKRWWHVAGARAGAPVLDVCEYIIIINSFLHEKAKEILDQTTIYIKEQEK